MKIRPLVSDAEALIPRLPYGGATPRLGGMRRMLDWLARNTDLVALFLAVVGLGVSLFTVWISVRQSRLDAYTRMHEMLVSPEVARGRRILFLAHTQGQLPEPGDADWDAINQSLAVYDTLAVYMQ